MTLPGPDEWPVADPLNGSTGDLLAERVGSTPDLPAVVDADEDETWTYRTLDRRVSERTGWLSRFSSPGERIATLLETGPGFVELFFAAGRHGTPLVPLNVRLDGETLSAQVQRSDAVAVVAAEETVESARQVADDSLPVRRVDGGTGGQADQPTADPTATAPNRASERLVVFTSGTTGRPKGVRLASENLVASAVGSAFRLGVRPGDRWLAPLPMYHVGGLAPLVRSTLYGTTTVLQRSFDPARTASVVDQRDVTGLSLVPTMLHRLLDWGWDPPESVRFVLLGGAPARPALLVRALERDIPVCPTYGLTETASQVATATPDDVREMPDTVGRPLRGTTVTIVDEQGAVVESGAEGELVVDGPTVTPGYLDADRTAAAVGEHGLHTGDVADRDCQDRLRVIGRLDDRIVTGGENVFPRTVSDALRELDGVDDAVVLGLPDDEWGERVAALVVGSDALTTGTVRERVRGSLADFEVPKTVAVADHLPRTQSGTVDREAVRERLRKHTDRG